jgi:methylated-DNA-[protein]-cysteine S-methyltransferase
LALSGGKKRNHFDNDCRLRQQLKTCRSKNEKRGRRIIRKAPVSRSGSLSNTHITPQFAHPSRMKFKTLLVTRDCPTPLGRLTLAASPAGLAWFEGQQHLPPELANGAVAGTVSVWPVQPSHPVLQEAARQISAYFDGTLNDFDLPLDLSAGTAFQQAVWQALRTLPRGRTCSYGDLSERIGRPAAVRAVGGAIARNPISLIVPCHRVIGAAGALTGYAGGLARKTALLQGEGALPAPGRSSRPKSA